ncbi:MAG TPA: extracellular solute-binding protein [Chloroflexia bacterium]|nr:extracellular solute-binding protein [Chloroflexia bacterium]
MPLIPQRTSRPLLGVLALVGALLTACGDTPLAAAPTATRPPPAAASTATRPPPGAAPGTDIAAILSTLALPRLDGVTLRVLVWKDSYKNLLTTFGRLTGATMDITSITSTDEQLIYLGTSGPIPYDVLSIPIDSIPANITQGRLAPIDRQQVSHYADLIPRLATLPIGTRDGQAYIVPTYWGYEGILYDPAVFPTPPASWDVFWDPRYKGQIAIWDDIEFVDNTALLLGLGQSSPSAIYNLTDPQLAQVQTKLLALKAQNPIFFQDPAELTALMAQGKIKLAFGWLVNAADLQDQGHDIRMTYPPREGTVVWYEALAVPSASSQKAAAFTLINTILDPAVQAWLSDRNYTVANAQAVRYFTPDQTAKAQRIFNLDLRNLLATTAQLQFQEPTARRDRYNAVWNRAKLGP